MRPMVRRLLLLAGLLFFITGGGGRPGGGAAEPERSVLEGGPRHLRHDRRGLVSHLPLRVALVRRLPRRREDVTGGTFCIDLRFWYPSKAFGYEKRSAAGLKNKAGKAVSASDAAQDEPRAVALRALRRRHAAGRRDDLCAPADGRRRAGRGRPEGALGGAASAIYAKVVSDAERFAGPYKVKATLPDKLRRRAGGPADRRGAHRRRAGRAGRGRRSLRDRRRRRCRTRSTPGRRHREGCRSRRNDPGNGIELDARTAASLPDVVPALYAPTKGQSARNAQRLVSARRRRQPTVEAAGPGAGAARAVDADQPTRAPTPGDAITDTVQVTGLGGQTATIQAALYGPYPPRDQIKCADAPVWTGTIDRDRRRRLRDRRRHADTPGYYTYRESIAESDTIAGVETACADVGRDDGRPRRADGHDAGQRAADRTRAPRSPTRRRVRPRASSARPSPSSSGARSRRATRSTAKARRSGRARSRANGDGPTRPRPVTLTAAGYYTYREGITGNEAYPTVGTGVVRRGVGDDAGQGRAAGHDRRLGHRRPARRAALRHADRHRPRQDPGDGRRRALRPVRLTRRHRLRGHARTGRARSTSPATAPTRLAEGHGPAGRLLRLPRTDRRDSRRSPPTRPSARSRPRRRSPRPAILGGRGDKVAYVSQGSGGAVEGQARPARDRRRRSRRSASTCKSGALGIPDEHQARRLVARRRDARRQDRHDRCSRGHVDSAKKGAGAFYALKSARRGDTVTVTRARRPSSYRVTTVKTMLKAALPDEHLHPHRLAEARAGDLRRPVRRQDRPLPRQRHRDRRPGVMRRAALAREVQQAQMKMLMIETKMPVASQTTSSSVACLRT